MAERSKRGRKGGLEQARALLSILGSLEGLGDSVTVEGVATMLSVDEARARRLVGMLTLLSGDADLFLPISISEDGGEVTLAFSGDVHGRPVRLTTSETMAVLAALDAVGLDDDDPTREVIESSFASTGVEPEEVERLLGGRIGQDEEELTLCSRALVEHKGITFSYQGSGQTEAQRRTVHPLALDYTDGLWYLDAIDGTKGALRTFRLDRMEDVELTDDPSTDADGSGPEDGSREVTLVFDDPRYLTLLTWPKAMVTPLDDGKMEMVLPYYGTDWLVRRIAACGGTVWVDDPELAGRVRSYAQEVLGS